MRDSAFNRPVKCGSVGPRLASTDDFFNQYFQKPAWANAVDALHDFRGIRSAHFCPGLIKICQVKSFPPVL
jgi:hypothetical protein